MKLAKVHIVPDQHIPFHDKQAWELQLKVVKYRKPDILITMGDFADFYSISSHQKDPKQRDLLLRDELAAVNRELARLENAAPRTCRKIFIQGNHCYRLERYLAQRAPDLHGMMDTAAVFQLAERGWEYVPYRHFIKVGDAHFTHDAGKSGSNAHVHAERLFNSSAVIGHTHRMAFEVMGDVVGQTRTAAMFGWGGDFNAIEYAHQASIRRAWALGFGTGYLHNDTRMHLTPVPILDYTCVVDGKLYVNAD